MPDKRTVSTVYFVNSFHFWLNCHCWNVDMNTKSVYDLFFFFICHWKFIFIFFAIQISIEWLGTCITICKNIARPILCARMFKIESSVHSMLCIKSEVRILFDNIWLHPWMAVDENRGFTKSSTDQLDGWWWCLQPFRPQTPTQQWNI